MSATIVEGKMDASGDHNSLSTAGLPRAEFGHLKTYGSFKGKRKNAPSTADQPLHRFVQAKKTISAIYDSLARNILDVLETMKTLMSEECDLVKESDVEILESYSGSVATIGAMFVRNHMKVVFFGRTSNGKSTVINAMLRSKVLPQGMGHTTKCFVQVEGSNNGEKYLTTEADSETRRDLASLDSLAHALSGDRTTLGEDALIQVHWPKEDSSLLKNEVVLLDSPGIDLSPEFDSWIDKHCLDADVFVLVLNAEATLTQSEKSFFYRVNSKLSKPNIFILNNRWDASAAEPERMEDVRKQHMTQFMRFLVEELNVCSEEEAQNRIFFVSAREVLTQRLKERGDFVSTPSSVSFIAHGSTDRALAFCRFEAQFETCLSKSAIVTKFEGHQNKGKEIVASVSELLERLQNEASETVKAKKHQHMCKMTELRSAQQNLNQVIDENRRQIELLSNEVQLKVSYQFAEQLSRLDMIIDSFHGAKFGDVKDELDHFKQCLLDYVDETVTKDLTERCTGGVLDRIIRLEREMIEGVRVLLPAEYSNRVDGKFLTCREPFRFTIRANCHSLMENFEEDLEFRFSLGIQQLIRGFLRWRKASLEGNGARDEGLLAGFGLVPKSIRSPEHPDVNLPSTSSLSPARRNLENGGGDQQQVVLLNSVVLTCATYVANGGVGLLIVGGLVYRTIGWRWLAAAAGAYCGLYAYERLMWNSSAKQLHFKRQFREHLSSQLRHLSHHYTVDCDRQVQSEVKEVLNRLRATSAEVQNKVKEELDQLQKQADKYEQHQQMFLKAKNSTLFLNSDLDDFREKYLESSAAPQEE